MKSKYLVDPTTFELPAIDAEITAFVENQAVKYADEVFHMAIEHNGKVYRVVTCEEGLTDLQDFNNFMNKHGYTDLAWEWGSHKGYSSYFVIKSNLRS
ncbi:MAG: hypothetical protein KH943_08050 [Haemophilus parahaemolyticus]|uniref:hypothetical protein n=1 Tax=Haemophilus parahaemolyticus TaxID=735 RepID=UPI0026EA3E49|nr:hypothetical protein [Haemophilus parahaemolyticus]MBS6009691.1 hypothetical protein [Haemophilus parahaemolyticus]